MLRRVFLINAVPGDKLVELPGQKRPAGYFQKFGGSAESENEMLSWIQEYVKNDLGSTIIEVENYGEPDFEDLDADIRDYLVGDVEEPGFWFIGGRAFYSKKGRERGSRSGLKGRDIN
jgi:hypothetical protein